MSKFYDKSAASFRSTTIDSKVIDVQKILINTDPSQIDERKNLIDYVENINNDITSVIKGGFKTAVYNTNVMNGTLDNATVTGIQYSNKHFVKGGSKIDSITFPYTPNSSVTSDGYLSAQVSVIEGVLENKIYYSTNKFNFGDTTKSEATFKFEDFILPENYFSVRFCLVSTRTSVPDNTQNTNCLSFRVKPIRYDNTFEFDVDGCYVYVNKDVKTWLIDSTINYGEPTKGIESIVLDNTEKVASLVEKTKLVSESAIATISSQPTNYGECDAFNIHKDKVPSAPIKSIEIPVVNTISTPTYIVVYDVDSATSTKKLLGNSRESITWTSGGVAKWTFENALNIPDGHNIEIYLAKASSVIGESNVAPVGYNISIYSNGTGNDRIRYGNSWNYTREIYLIFHTEEERNLGEAIQNSENNLDVLSQIVSDNILSTEEKINELETQIETYDDFVSSTNSSISTINTTLGNTAKTNAANTFTAANTFNSTSTTKGAATFDSTITKSTTSSTPASLANTQVLNKAENDTLYAPKSHVSDTSVHMSAVDRQTLAEVVEVAEEITTAAADFAKKTVENTFVESNTFKKTITVEGGINAVSGDIFVANGVLTFEDLVDGTVIERSGASGYQYVTGMPTSFNNGICYDIGEISNNTDFSNITFSAEGRLVQTCEVWFTTPATVPTTHQWPKNIYWIDSATGAAPTLIASKNYRLVFRQEPNKIIASIAYLY